MKEREPEIIKALKDFFLNKCSEKEISSSQWYNANIALVHKKVFVTCYIVNK